MPDTKNDAAMPEHRDPKRRVWPITSYAGTCEDWRER